MVCMYSTNIVQYIHTPYTYTYGAVQCSTVHALRASTTLLAIYVELSLERTGSLSIRLVVFPGGKTRRSQWPTRQVPLLVTVKR